MNREIRLSEILEGSATRPLADVGADPLILGASLDSRRTEPGDLFFAIRGFNVDGERFAADAIGRGARAVVAESPRPAAIASEVGWVQVAGVRQAIGPITREFYGRPDEHLALVGITGTNGKTTVTHIVESIGKAAGRRSGRIGTVGCSIDGSARPLARTTPEAPELYRLLAEMRDRSVSLVAMEVSSHALTLGRVGGARFTVAAFLNLSLDHLDFHGDPTSYFEAKAKLFDTLGSAAHAVLPADTKLGAELRQRTSARVLTFGRSSSAMVRLRNEHCTLEGSSAILETPLGALPIRTFLLGRTTLDNVAAAAACALALGLPVDSVPTGVLALQGVPGRMETVDAGQPFTALVDYAHTPDALETLLAWLRQVVQARLRVVFGCGGERDRAKRREMGRVAAEFADDVFLTSDNPRGEDPRKILDQIAEGVAGVAGGSDRCHRIEDRTEAIRAALTAAGKGDVVVVAGKGHETTQSVGGVERPFDDRRVALAALAELGFGGERRADA